MPGIPFIDAQLTIQFTNRNMRIPAMVIPDPLEFLFCVGIRMWRMWSVGSVKERLLCAVESAVPAHERSLGDVVSSADIGNSISGTVEFYSVIFCS